MGERHYVKKLITCTYGSCFIYYITYSYYIGYKTRTKLIGLIPQDLIFLT